MSKALVPNREEIRRILLDTGKTEALVAFDDAWAQGHKLLAIRIAREAGAMSGS